MTRTRRDPRIDERAIRLIEEGKGEEAIRYFLENGFQPGAKISYMANQTSLLRTHYAKTHAMNPTFISKVTRKFPDDTFYGRLIREPDDEDTRRIFWNFQAATLRRGKIVPNYDRDLSKIMLGGTVPFPHLVNTRNPPEIQMERKESGKTGRFNLTNAQAIYDRIVEFAKGPAGFEQIFAVLALCGRRGADLITAEFKSEPNDTFGKYGVRILDPAKDRKGDDTYVFPILLNWDDWSEALSKARTFLRDRGIEIPGPAGQTQRYHSTFVAHVRKMFEDDPILKGARDSEDHWVTVHDSRKLYVALAMYVFGTNKKDIVKFVKGVLGHVSSGSVENYAPRFDSKLIVGKRKKPE